jgi:uncharacterized protein (DUF433 family)
LFADEVPEWLRHVIVDPQTSGGLALFSRTQIPGAVQIGSVAEGPPRINVV